MNGLRRSSRAFLASALCALAVLWCACGLKGPPIPPDATKADQPAARSGSGPLQFGPRAPKSEDDEDKKILELYGRKPPQDSGNALPGDALGVNDIMAEPDDGTDAPDESASPFDPAAATPTTTPPPAESDDDADTPEETE